MEVHETDLQYSHLGCQA